jgi:hypothetical protein
MFMLVSYNSSLPGEIVAQDLCMKYLVTTNAIAPSRSHPVRHTHQGRTSASIRNGDNNSARCRFSLRYRMVFGRQSPP